MSSAQSFVPCLRYRAVRGTVSDFRSRAMEVLKGCEVEMLIIDEADSLKPETFPDMRDINDKLEIAVVLVGTDRLDAVIKQDEQVYNRFRAHRRFGKLAGEEFKKTGGNLGGEGFEVACCLESDESGNAENPDEGNGGLYR